MRNSWSATTDEAGSAILGAPFWKPGVKIVGIYVRSFMTRVGECKEFMAANPITANLDENGYVVPSGKGGKETKLDKFSMGALTGFEMAIQGLQAKGFDGFRFKDQVTITCTGTKEPEYSDQSPMPLFDVKVDRP